MCQSCIRWDSAIHCGMSPPNWRKAFLHVGCMQARWFCWAGVLDPSQGLTGGQSLAACEAGSAGCVPPHAVLPGFGAKTPSAAIVVRAAPLMPLALTTPPQTRQVGSPAWYGMVEGRACFKQHPLRPVFSGWPKTGASPELLKVALRNQAFHIALPDVELAVLRQVDSSVLCVSSEFRMHEATARNARARLTRIQSESRPRP